MILSEPNRLLDEFQIVITISGCDVPENSSSVIKGLTSAGSVKSYRSFQRATAPKLKAR